MQSIDLEQLYLQECGDRLIKLCMQLLIRHLNHVTDLFSKKEKSVMTTKIVLKHIEELSQL